MKIKCKYMYMVPFDHGVRLYAWSVYRVWWKPWRYNLRFYRMGNTRVNELIDLQEEVYENLTFDGLNGTLKLFDLWKD